MSEPASTATGRIDGHSSVTLRAPGGRLEATFLPELGMVGCSLRHDGEELLAQRGGVAAYAEKGSTFGLPLLYPWANRLGGWDYAAEGHAVTLERQGGVHVDGATGLPSHGLHPAAMPWRVTETGSDERRAWCVAELEWDESEERRRAFPFPHRLRHHATLERDGLTVRTEVLAGEASAVPVSFGFHPYLTLPGSEREEWTIELPVRRRVILDDRGIPTGATEEIGPEALSGPLGERTFDDSFDRFEAGPGSHPVLSVSDRRRRLAMRFGDGFTVAQVYAPEGSPFIAMEPMTAPVDALRSGHELRRVPPGGAFSAEFTLAVS